MDKPSGNISTGRVVNIHPSNPTGKSTRKYGRYILGVLALTGGLSQFAGEKLGLGYLGATSLRETVDARNSRLNHSFNISELSRDALARELIMTTMYEYSEALDIIPETKGRLSKIVDMFPIIRDTVRRIPQSGGVFLRTPDGKSFDEIAKSVAVIRSENPSAIIAIDFEGGYVRTPHVSQDDLKKYGFPQAIIDLSQEEKTTTKSKTLGQFPSAEFIGLKYQGLKDPKSRKEFLMMMQNYGQAIGKLFSAYGINLIFGPSLDITDNTIGTKQETSPFAKNDRAFSNNPKNVSELGNAFIEGTMKVPGFIAVPKHFVGTGLTAVNTDIARSTDTKLRDGALLPFRDYLNLHEVDGMTADEAVSNIAEWQPGGSKYNGTLKLINQEIKRLQTEVANLELEDSRLSGEIAKLSKTKKLAKSNSGKIQILSDKLRKVRASRNTARAALNKASGTKVSEISRMYALVQDRSNKLQHIQALPPVIMVGNNDNNFYQSKTPGSLSPKTIKALMQDVSRTTDGYYGGMGGNGVIITDDLYTGAIKDYLGQKGDKVFSVAAKAALTAGNHFLLFGDSNFSEIIIGARDVPIEELREKARRILDMKVSIGIYSKKGDRYTLNPKMYNPSKGLVKQSAQSSKIWTGNDQRYIDEGGKIEHISVANGTKNAINNSILDICRIDPGKIIHTLCSIHPKMYDSYLAPDESNLRKQLIVVDKREQMLYGYDFATRELLYSKPIAIGKGTESLDGFQDKRVSGDKKTPVGYYMLVQKKDPKRIKESIETELYDEYGGDDGGMLVLAGAWQPQIAIHGTKKETVGLVSSGCVRMDNSSIRKMMDQVPLGSMVIVTN